MILLILCLVSICVFGATIQCPPGTNQVAMTGCEGTMTRVLGNSPSGSCDADFTVWVNQAQPSSEIGYGILSGDFTAQTLTVSQSLSVPAGAVNTDDIADGAVTNAKIADGTIKSAKLEDTVAIKKDLTVGGNIVTPGEVHAQGVRVIRGAHSGNRARVYVGQDTDHGGGIKYWPDNCGDHQWCDSFALVRQHYGNEYPLLVSRFAYPDTPYFPKSIEVQGTAIIRGTASVGGRLTTDGITVKGDVLVTGESIFDGTLVAGTVRGTGHQGRLTMNGLFYVNSGGATHKNSGFGGAIGYQTYLRNRDNEGPHRMNWANSAQQLSIWATGAIQAGNYIGASDLRIKKDVRDIKNHEALQQIRQLDAKSYKYRDPVKRGDAEVLGFIAQDVKNTIPHAVYPKTDFIPNEMRVFDVQWKTDAETGHKKMVPTETLAPGRYKFVMIQGQEEVEEKLTTKDGKTFLKDEDTPYTSDQSYDSVFLYGKEVDDFLTIDKNKIFAVAYAALQEVDRIQQAMQDKIEKLEERLAALESK